jgi:hypothetical protein
MDMSTPETTNLALNSIRSPHGWVSCWNCNGTLNIRKLAIEAMPIGTKIMIKFSRHAAERTLNLDGEGEKHALRLGVNKIVPAYYLFNYMGGDMGTAGHYYGVQITPGGNYVLVDDFLGPVFINQLPYHNVDFGIYEVESHENDENFLRQVYDQQEQEYFQLLLTQIEKSLQGINDRRDGLMTKAESKVALYTAIAADDANADRPVILANAQQSVREVRERLVGIRDQIAALVGHNPGEAIVNRLADARSLLVEHWETLGNLSTGLLPAGR